MVQKLLNLKQRILKLQQFFYVQETFRKAFFVDNMKKAGFNGYVYDFTVDYDAIVVEDILDINK